MLNIFQIASEMTELCQSKVRDLTNLKHCVDYISVATLCILHNTGLHNVTSLAYLT